MNQTKLLSIMEFSRLTGIRRENLRFYDRIGLLSPDKRGDNNYRYYSRHQLSAAYLIVSLRGLGVGIEEIKQYATRHTPENMMNLFTQQDARIEAEMQQLRQTRQILRIHADMVGAALLHDENDLFLERREEESIFLCPPIPDYMDEDEGGLFSYDFAEANGVDLGSPQGSMIPQRRLEPQDTTQGYQYYFKVGSGGNAYKPPGLYAVAYGQCDLSSVENLYRSLLEFIRAQGLRVCGDGYEEYPFGDIGVQGREQYCIRLEIPVAGRNSNPCVVGPDAPRTQAVQG